MREKRPKKPEKTLAAERKRERDRQALLDDLEKIFKETKVASDRIRCVELRGKLLGLLRDGGPPEETPQRLIELAAAEEEAARQVALIWGQMRTGNVQRPADTSPTLETQPIDEPPAKTDATIAGT